MSQPIILASGSVIRRQLLENAGVAFDVQKPRVDEVALKAAMRTDQAKPRDIADALAEAKARRISAKMPHALVIGCDQVLQLGDDILSKPDTMETAKDQLLALRGRQHTLLSAVVIYDDAAPVWRHVGQVRLHMRDFSDSFLDEYLDRNWPAVQSSVGAYQIEGEGIRLFSKIEGDYFTVLGLPLLEVVMYLTQRGDLKA
ncbi:MULTISPECIES: Maf family protein [Sediminimonas]|uniref:Maf family protein n=1 Tax=Sediminimonas TaxID=659427 RepID=UPI0004012F74|nr:MULTISPECIES: Maf family nucleotide pyrophosphatase [Sediminimonas]MDR9484709.1 Maf family nucleotide pyrophosphatase [Sediminimonas sp.]